MLVKCAPVFYFTNSLRAVFALIFFSQKLQCQTVIRGKLHTTLSKQKAAYKILVKLNYGRAIDTFLRAHLCTLKKLTKHLK